MKPQTVSPAWRRLATAWEGFDPDTRDSLRGVRSEARGRYYGASGMRTLLEVVAVAVSLALMVSGLLVEKPLGFVLVLGGVLGLALTVATSVYR